MSTGKQDVAEFADIVSMTQNGLVTYLMSLKKIMGKKVDPKVISAEVERLQEPFTRHMLEVIFSGLEPATARSLARAKGRQIKAELAVKLSIVQAGCVALAAGDNPRKALARMRSHMEPMTAGSEQAAQAASKPAQTFMDGPEEKWAEYLPSLADSRAHLLVKFLALNIAAKKAGIDTMEAPAQAVTCAYCSEGLLLAVDGYESAFVADYTNNRAQAILDAVDRKIEAGVETAVAVRIKASYEDALWTAKSYLP